MLLLCTTGPKQYVPSLVNDVFVMLNLDVFNLLYSVYLQNYNDKNQCFLLFSSSYIRVSALITTS